MAVIFPATVYTTVGHSFQVAMIFIYKQRPRIPSPASRRNALWTRQSQLWGVSWIEIPLGRVSRGPRRAWRKVLDGKYRCESSRHHLQGQGTWQIPNLGASVSSFREWVCQWFPGHLWGKGNGENTTVRIYM